MKNFIKNSVLENTSFSVDTIGPLAYIIHKMSGEGTYHVEIYHKNIVIVKSQIICDDKFEKNSENIDIADVLEKRAFPKLRLNADNGYVLFYNSKDFTTNRIVIKKGTKIEFDNKKPSESDMYALNLMKPGSYNLKSKAIKKPLKIDVQYPSLSTSKESRFSKSLSITSQNISKMKEQNVLPNQGLVFNLGKGFTEFQLEMVKENVPKRGMAINDQIKKEAKSMVTRAKKRSTKGMKKKYQWKAN